MANRRIQPLYVSGNLLYASNGTDVVVSSDDGASFQSVGKGPGRGGERWASRLRLLSRLGRLGIHDLRPLPDGSMVAVLRQRIVRCGPGERQFREVLRIKRGSRPLGLCPASSGYVYFGEYFNNPERESVHIYGSDDGEHWSVVHTFPAGTIRHVHNIIEDPYRGGLWVLTGDSDKESGLWFSDDHFRSLELVVGGTQRARAVSIIPLEEGLIVPTDTPFEQNYIQHCDPDTGNFTRLASIPNSAFHAVKTGNLLLVSTVAEPSLCNDTEYATVYASADGATWHCFAKFKRDWSLIRNRHRFVDRAIRHPEIRLVPGHNDTEFVFGFGRAIQGADGRMIKWMRSEINECIRFADAVAS